EARRLGACPLHRLPAVHGRHHPIASVLEPACEHVAVRFVVVDEQYLVVHSRLRPTPCLASMQVRCRSAYNAAALMVADRGRPTLLTGLLLAFAVAVAVCERAPALFDDRSWFDETYVFLESMGISFSEPWPSRYVRADLGLSPSIANV